MTSFPYKFTTFCLNIYITGFCCYHHLSCHPQPNHVWGILVWWTAFCFLSWCLVKFLLSDEKTFSFSSASYSVVKSAKKLTIEVQLSQRIARFVQYPNQWELLVYVSSTDFIFQVDFYLCNSQLCNYNCSFPFNRSPCVPRKKLQLSAPYDPSTPIVNGKWEQLAIPIIKADFPVCFWFVFFSWITKKLVVTLVFLLLKHPLLFMVLITKWIVLPSW